MNNKAVIIFTILAFVVGGVFYLLYPTPNEYKSPENPTDENEQVFCTQDAMLCPDGSYVGRTGPNCEFLCSAEALCEGGVPCPIPPGTMMEDGTLDQ